MISSLVAVDPVAKKGAGFKRFAGVVRRFQKHGILSQTSVASVIHPSLYTLPTKWYREQKERLALEASVAVTQACSGKFEFDRAGVLLTDDHSSEGLVAKVSSFAKRKDKDLLVVASSDRVGLPRWALGSFAETAALTARLPVLIIKTRSKETDFSPTPSFLLAVDTDAPPTAKDLKWLARMTRASGKAHFEVAYVTPPTLGLTKGFQQEQKTQERSSDQILKRIAHDLRSLGIEARSRAYPLKKSIVQTLSVIADQRKAWLIITTAPQRSSIRKLLLGSTARKILRVSDRPFLTLRME